MGAKEWKDAKKVIWKDVETCQKKNVKRKWVVKKIAARKNKPN